MAIDAFLKLEGVDGESHDDKHKGWIDILSWSWGATQSGTAHLGGGGGAGKVDMGDVSVVKYFDKASSALMQKVATGKHIATGELKMRKAGDEKLDYLVIKLSDIMITSFQTGSSAGEERQTESLSLNFAKIEWTYKEQLEDGTGGAETKMGYDIRKQVPTV